MDIRSSEHSDEELESRSRYLGDKGKRETIESEVTMSGNNSDGTVLLPCPFCGFDAKMRESVGMRMEGNKFLVGCKNPACLMLNGTGKVYSKSDAALVWNRRALPAPVVTEEVRTQEEEQAMKVEAIMQLLEQAIPPSDIWKDGEEHFIYLRDLHGKIPAAQYLCSVYRKLAIQRDSLLREVEELKAAIPRVWTAETIKDAPEGEYRCKYSGKWSVNGTRPKYDIIHQMEADKIRKLHGASQVTRQDDEFFGPRPQPPKET